MNDDKMRAEFEKWVKANAHFDVSRVNNPALVFHGQYKSVVTDIVWRLYQAAYQAGRKAEREAMQKEALQQLTDEAQELDMGY